MSSNRVKKEENVLRKDGSVVDPTKERTILEKNPDVDNTPVRRNVGGDGKAKRSADVRLGKRKHSSIERGTLGGIMSYRFVRGLRLVDPYVYRFRTYAKGRWFDRTLLDVLSKEFRRGTQEESRAYFTAAMKAGLLRVNGKAGRPDDVFRNGDLLEHIVHRHEPPVRGDPIVTVYDEDNFLVVSKPPTIPVHPCGAYHHNSLVNILQNESKDRRALYSVHRIDRLTSGLLVMARNPDLAKRVSAAIKSRDVTKTYIARVRGEFPLGKDDADNDSIVRDAKSRCAAADIRWQENGFVRVSCPMRAIDPRRGIHQCREDGREAVSEFRRRSRPNAFGGVTSVVECRPVTGRTHQLRLHLQLLGFPIANDGNYGGDFSIPYGDFDATSTSSASAERALDACAPKLDSESEKAARALCNACQNPTKISDTLHYHGIWLHSSQFRMADRTFKCNDPAWAIETGVTEKR